MCCSKLGQSTQTFHTVAFGKCLFGWRAALETQMWQVQLETTECWGGGKGREDQVLWLRTEVCMCMCVHVCKTESGKDRQRSACVCLWLSVFVQVCLCVTEIEIKGADSIHWDTRGHRGEKVHIQHFPLRGGEWLDSWRVRRCRWCCWTCREAANLTSLIRSYLALLQFHGCLNQVGHVPQISAAGFYLSIVLLCRVMWSSVGKRYHFWNYDSWPFFHPRENSLKQWPFSCYCAVKPPIWQQTKVLWNYLTRAHTPGFERQTIFT